MSAHGASHKSQWDGGRGGVVRGVVVIEKEALQRLQQTMERACVPTDNFQPQSFQPTPFLLLVLLFEESESQINKIRHLEV